MLSLSLLGQKYIYICQLIHTACNQSSGNQSIDEQPARIAKVGVYVLCLQALAAKASQTARAKHRAAQTERNHRVPAKLEWQTVLENEQKLDTEQESSKAGHGIGNESYG